MKTFENLNSWFEFRNEILRNQRSIGFVPTMGALHDGHLSLIKKSQSENDLTIVSIFVNPTQFNNPQDFAKYPRTLDTDLTNLEALNVDAVILPSETQVYEHGYKFKVSEHQDSEVLCGAHRPGHFTGVLTVVLKLFGIVQPDRCYMGEKDFQQLQLVRQMAEDLFLKTQVIGCPTVREDNGLAKSSRNVRLSPEGLKIAAKIYETLQLKISTAEARQKLSGDGFEVEYVEDHWNRRFVAAWLEGVRLIDNVPL